MVSRGPKGSGRGAAGDAEAELSTRRATRATPIVVGGGGPLFPGPHGPAGFGLPSHYPVVPLPSRGHALPTPSIADNLALLSPSFALPSRSFSGRLAPTSHFALT